MRRLFLLCLVLSTAAFAQYTNLSEINEYGGPQEFAARRAELAKKIGGKGTILLFARVTLPEAAHYREDNDFFYYTGLREPGAILVLDAAACRPTIFQPQYSARMIQVLGPTILSRSNEERMQLGYPTALPVTEIDNVLARVAMQPDAQLWARLGFPDKADGARGETGSDNARHYS